MKKKIILMLTLVLMLSCLLVITANAEFVTYDDAPTKTNIEVRNDDVVVFDDGFSCPSAYIFKDSKTTPDGSWSLAFNNATDFSYINGKTGKAYTFANVVELDIPQGITYVGKYSAYKSTTLKKVSFPDSVTTLGVCIFEGATGLEECVFEHNENSDLTTIPAYMFSSNTNLKALSLPDCVTTITGTNVFSKCTGMTAVYLSKNLTSIINCGGGTGRGDLSTFDNCPKMYLVNEPFTYDNIPEKPSVYYFPKGLNEFDNNSIFRGCNQLNDVLVFGTEFKSILNTYTFEKAGTQKIVFLGDMETVVCQYWFSETNGKHYTDIYFANPADKSASDLALTQQNGQVIVYCNADGNTTHLLEKTVSTEADCVNNEKVASLCFCGAEISKQEVEGSALGHEFDVTKGAIDLGIVYAEGFFKSGIHSYDCARCDVIENAPVKPIFHWVGYSAKTFGDEKAFGQQYVINQAELGDYKAYVESQGDIFSYGVVAAGASSAGQPLSVAGNEVVNKEGAQSICFDQLSYDAFFMNISGIDAGSLDVALMCCAYVRVGNEIVYLDNNQTVDTVELTSFAKIDAIVNPKEEIA